MISVPLNEKIWIEQCRDCQKPMTKMMRQFTDVIRGVPGTLGYEIGNEINPEANKPKGYDQWCIDGQVDDLWFCKACDTLWGKCLGYWFAKCGGSYSLTFL